jgi:hypothetical protein
MPLRWIIGSVLILALVLTALDLSANVRHRARARKPPSVADVMKGRAEDQSPPHAAEVEETPTTAPAITY